MDSGLGIVGLGRIGKSLAVRAQAMKMDVIATESMPDEAFVEQHGIELLDLNELLRRADHVSLHCPLSDETRGLINSEALDLMRPDATLVNTARGGLVVEADLVDALKSGRIAGAGLDVFEQEPTDTDNSLYDLDNVILSPHIAGSDHLSREHMGDRGGDVHHQPVPGALARRRCGQRRAEGAVALVTFQVDRAAGRS